MSTQGARGGSYHAGVHPDPHRLPPGSWWDWEVVSWDAGEFLLAAGADLSYTHGLELAFGEPVFVSCPFGFRDPVFRAPTGDEIASVGRRFDEAPPVLVAFEADTGGREPSSCLIGARHLDVRHELVYRYWRPDTAPGQRFAPWVRTPHHRPESA